MGEPQEHIHSFNPHQLKAIIEALRPEPVPSPEPRAVTLDELLLSGIIEPWNFHDPHQACEVTTYVDDRNQLRHVPVTRASEVPAAWRRVLLA